MRSKGKNCVCAVKTLVDFFLSVMDRMSVNRNASSGSPLGRIVLNSLSVAEVLQIPALPYYLATTTRRMGCCTRKPQGRSVGTLRKEDSLIARSPKKCKHLLAHMVFQHFHKLLQLPLAMLQESPTHPREVQKSSSDVIQPSARRCHDKRSQHRVLANSFGPKNYDHTHESTECVQPCTRRTFRQLSCLQQLPLRSP